MESGLCKERKEIGKRERGRKRKIERESVKQKEIGKEKDR